MKKFYPTKSLWGQPTKHKPIYLVGLLWFDRMVHNLSLCIIGRRFFHIGSYESHESFHWLGCLVFKLTWGFTRGWQGQYLRSNYGHIKFGKLQARYLRNNYGHLERGNWQGQYLRSNYGHIKFGKLQARYLRTTMSTLNVATGRGSIWEATMAILNLGSCRRNI